MLQDRGHPLWSDKTFEQEIISKLGDNRDAFVETVAAIEGLLADVRREADRLEPSADDHAEVSLASLYKRSINQTSVLCRRPTFSWLKE